MRQDEGPFLDGLNALDQLEADAQQLRREMREVLKAWGLGQADHMNAAMLPLFLREFGKAPEPEALAEREGG